jgi:hypothetical protein
LDAFTACNQNFDLKSVRSIALIEWWPLETALWIFELEIGLDQWSMP